jgi:hypothetical protein
MPGSYKVGGLIKNKYVIAKTDGQPIDEKAAYFLLRLDEDPHARMAAMMYAASVEQENPQLARELRAWVGEFESPGGKI